MDDIRLIYVTAASRDQAIELARTLVGERLVACANILPEITSIYWWDGAVQQEPEVALIAKTRADLVEAVTARVGELHSYSCPCVVAMPVVGGNPAFLDWIKAETVIDVKTAR